MKNKLFMPKGIWKHWRGKNLLNQRIKTGNKGKLLFSTSHKGEFSPIPPRLHAQKPLTVPFTHEYEAES